MSAPSRPLSLLSTALSAILVLANVIVLNMWVRSFDARIDLTEDERFSLSEGTKNILAGFDGNVSVKCYLSTPLPKQFDHVDRVLLEKLREYESILDGKVVFEFTDPDIDETAKQECNDLGIQPVRVAQYKDLASREEVSCYMAMVFRYADRKAILNLTTDLAGGIYDERSFASDLEFYLTSNIRKITSERKTVGIFANIQEVANPMNPRAPKQKTQGVENLKAWLERSYDVVTLDPKAVGDGQPIPPDIDTLIVFRPKEVTELATFMIDQFVMRGGNTMFLIDAAEVAFSPIPTTADIGGGRRVRDYTMPSYRATPIETGVTDLLEHYGVRVEPQLVQDESCARISWFKGKELRQRRGIRGIQAAYELIDDFGPYKSWPLIPARGDDGARLSKSQLADNPIVSGVDDLVLTWTSPLTLIDENLKRNDARGEVLIRTGPESWVEEIKDSIFSPEPDTALALEPRLKPAPIATLMTGRFQSFFKDAEIPRKASTTGEPLPLERGVAESRRDSCQEPVSIFTIGCAAFVYDNVLRVVMTYDMRGGKSQEQARVKPREVLRLIMDAVDVLSYGTAATDLISIKNRREISKTRAISIDRLGKLPTLGLNLGIIPGLIVLFAAVWLFLRYGVAR